MWDPVWHCPGREALMFASGSPLGRLVSASCSGDKVEEPLGCGLATMEETAPFSAMKNPFSVQLPRKCGFKRQLLCGEKAKKLSEWKIPLEI